MNANTKLLSFALNKIGQANSTNSKKNSAENPSKAFDGLIQGFHLTKMKENLFGTNQTGKKKIFIPIKNLIQSKNNSSKKTTDDTKTNKSDIVSANENNMMMRSLSFNEKNRNLNGKAKGTNSDDSKTNLNTAKSTSGKLNNTVDGNRSQAKPVKLNTVKSEMKPKSAQQNKKGQISNSANFQTSVRNKAELIDGQTLKNSAKLQKDGVKSNQEAKLKSQSQNGNNFNPNIKTDESKNSLKTNAFESKTKMTKTELPGKSNQNTKSTNPESNLAKKIKGGVKADVYKSHEINKAETQNFSQLKTNISGKNQTAQNVKTTNDGFKQAAKVEAKSAIISGTNKNVKVNNNPKLKQTDSKKPTETLVKNQSAQNVKMSNAGLKQTTKVEQKSTQNPGPNGNVKVGNNQEPKQPASAKSNMVKTKKAETLAKNQSAQNVKMSNAGLKQTTKVEQKSAQKPGTNKNAKVSTNPEIKQPASVKSNMVKTKKAETLVKNQSAQNVKMSNAGLKQTTKVEPKSTQKPGTKENVKVSNNQELKQPASVKSNTVKTKKTETLVKNQSAQNVKMPNAGLKQTAKVESKSTQKPGAKENVKVSNNQELKHPVSAKSNTVETKKAETLVKNQSTQNGKIMSAGLKQTAKVEAESIVKSQNNVNVKISNDNSHLKTQNSGLNKTDEAISAKNNVLNKTQSEKNKESAKPLENHSSIKKETIAENKSEIKRKKIVQNSEITQGKQSVKTTSQKQVQDIPIKNNDPNQIFEKQKDLKPGFSGDKTNAQFKNIASLSDTENSKSNTKLAESHVKESFRTQKSTSDMNDGSQSNKKNSDGNKNASLNENQNNFKPDSSKNSTTFKSINSEMQSKVVNSEKISDIKQNENVVMPAFATLNSPEIKSAAIIAARQIVQIINTTKTVKNNTTSFKIDGGDLGQLEIKFSKESDGDGAKIIVMSEMTKSVIQKMIPTIQGELVEKGVSLSSLDVEVEHSEQKEKNNQAQNQKGNRHTESKNFLENDKMIETEQKIKDYGYNTIEVVA